MNLYLRFIVTLELTPLVAAACARTVQQQPVAPPSARVESRVLVPEGAAALVRPILDLREASVSQCGEPGTASRCTDGEAHQRELERERRLGELLAQLTQRKDARADEALVVLMCFYIGESQEEEDAVIQRGRRMMRLLNKYRHTVPRIPDRAYPDSMLKGASNKEDSFRGAIVAIERGWRGTWDSPGG
jgi:hypothetical protein